MSYKTEIIYGVLRAWFPLPWEQVSRLLPFDSRYLETKYRACCPFPQQTGLHQIFQVYQFIFRLQVFYSLFLQLCYHETTN